jgi:hypothetical protein
MSRLDKKKLLKHVWRSVEMWNEKRGRSSPWIESSTEHDLRLALISVVKLNDAPGNKLGLRDEMARISLTDDSLGA